MHICKLVCLPVLTPVEPTVEYTDESVQSFSFQFLLECARRLGHLSSDVQEEKYFWSLLQRIRTVCQGHLKWLYLAKRRDPEGHFKANYWVNGDNMCKPETSESWIPEDGFVDTAYQILKATSITKLYPPKVYQQHTVPAWVGEIVREWVYPWVSALDKCDKRGKYAWPHVRDDGVNRFRLDDHVWAWMALNSLEVENIKVWKPVQELVSLPSEEGKGTEPSTSAQSKDEINRLSQKFTASVVQREVLRRFTTENDARKRMLAVTRSPRETRFLFHSHDTALFYGLDKGFFLEDGSIHEPWTNTIVSQPYHEENQETWWQDALRYALSIVIGTRGHRINNRTSEELVKVATETLFRIASPNGCFPGQLDITKKPLEEVFSEEQDRDSYYHANFEIQYILLTHADDLNRIVHGPRPPPPVDRRVDSKAKAKAKATTDNLQVETESGLGRPQLPSQLPHADLSKQDLQSSGFVSRQEVVQLETPADITRRGPDEYRLVMKRAIPFNKLIDSSRIVQPDDEWMFDYPQFFDRETPIFIGEEFERLHELKSSLVKDLDVEKLSIQNTSGSQPDTVGSTIPTSSWVVPRADVKFLIVDIPRRKRLERWKQGKKPLKFLWLKNNRALWDAVSVTRTAILAKKRLVCLYDADSETAFLCVAASQGYEQSNMADFFERYSRYEKYLYDACTMVSNTWETEVHISFYQLLETYRPPSQGMRPLAPVKTVPFPGSQDKRIIRSVMSFRFDGDFFDRNWTCHVLDHQTSHKPSQGQKWQQGQEWHQGQDWRQRKVLELYLFNRILHQLTKSTGGILEKIELELNIDSGSFSYSAPSSDVYSTWSTLWQGLDHLLQALEQDVAKNLDIVSQWDSREEERGEQKPRWTRNDEKKYRATITKAHFEVRREISKLRRIHDDMKSLRELYSNHVKNTREELSFRSNQNVASFTYVTVVFLPLGFAASVFSMNGPPPGPLIVSMVIFAVVALVVTIFALMNARTVAVFGKDIASVSQSYTRKAMSTSIISQSGQQQEANKRTAEDETSFKSGDQESQKISLSSFLTFWLTYLLIEVPARRIARAYRILDNTPRLHQGILTVKTLGIQAIWIQAKPSQSSWKIMTHIGKNAIHLVGGLFILPVFLISWSCQLLLYNIKDILVLIAGQSTLHVTYWTLFY